MMELTAVGIDEAVLNFSRENVWIMNAILAVVTFSIAIDLTPSAFRNLAQAPKSLLTGLFSQFVLLPTMTFGVILITRPMPSVALGLILVAACPGGITSNYITHHAKGNTALSVSMTAISSVAAIILTPLNIAFWGSLYEPTHDLLRKTSIDPVSVFLTIGLILVLPMCMGMLCNLKMPDVSARLRAPLKYLSWCIFLSFIILALMANWEHFVRFAPILAGLVILHNTLAFGCGYSLASLMKLSSFDRRAVTIETGIQNLGLGLALTFGFFNGIGGMAVVVALWGIWHIVSGFFLATLMARRNVLAEYDMLR